MVLVYLSLSLFALHIHIPCASADPNQGTLVNLRIEGEGTTIFEGAVLTRGHNVVTALSGEHRCDGTNNGANAHPGPTCTSALDDAAQKNGFKWDGKYFPLFDDYLVSSIAGESATSSQFWSLALNYQLTDVGGCQQQVRHLDHVLFAFDGFGKDAFLKLAGPSSARAHDAVALSVTNGVTGLPVVGALVYGVTSDAAGHVSLIFDEAGLKKVKAEKKNAIRSNSLDIVVAL